MRVTGLKESSKAKGDSYSRMETIIKANGSPVKCTAEEFLSK